MTGGIASRSDSPSAVLSAQVCTTSRGGAVRVKPNTCVGTQWVLLPATYTPPTSSTELEFRIQDGVVGRGRTVSRVLYPLRDGDHLSATPVARRL